MNTIELLLIPIYVFLFYLYFRRKRKNLENDTLKKYHKRAFWLKIVATLLFVLYYTYLTGGDTRSLFFTEGNNLFHLLLQDSANWKYIFSKGKDFNETLVAAPYNFGYFLHEGNYMVIRMTALLSFLSFGQYTLISLFFGSFAFSGLWKLFKFFYEKRPHLHRAFAVSILFFPSVLFWSSGLLKDSVCMGALGWFTYSLDQFLQGKKLIRNGSLVAISMYLIAIIKIYILLAYLPFLLLYIFLSKLNSAKVNIIKVLGVLFISGSIVITFMSTYANFEDELGAYAVENLTSTITTLNETLTQTNRQGNESNFNLGAEFDGTLSGLVNMAPYAIAATFYRPFIWETRKLSQLMAAVESLILMFLTLKIILKKGPFRFIKYILSDPMILFCFSFAVVFGLFVGSSTINFGSLVRYKIPCMPFYCIALYLMYEKARSKVKKTELADAATPADTNFSLYPEGLKIAVN